jgi:very-short-patch-repair endonuclease
VLGLKFRRQDVLGPYILDFFCFEASLAVEVDGDFQHEDKAAYDERRDAYLAEHGVKVLRVPAAAVGDRLERVVAWITVKAQQQLASRPSGG